MEVAFILISLTSVGVYTSLKRMSSFTEPNSIAPDSFHRRGEVFAQETCTQFDTTIKEFDTEKCVGREIRNGTSNKSTSRKKDKTENLS